MNDMQLLMEEVELEFPDTMATIDPEPLHPAGLRFMDIERPGRPKVVVQLIPDLGFGLHYRHVPLLAGGPDEIRIHRFSALQRIRELLE